QPAGQDIEIFDQEKLLAEDDETAIKVIRDDQEIDWINAVKIDDTGKAIVKVKLRKKSDEDYKKQQEALKDDKQARLFLKVTCRGDDRKHKKVFLKPIEEDQYIHPIAFEHMMLITGRYNPDHGDFHDPIVNPQVRGWYNKGSKFNKDSTIGGWNPYASMRIHKNKSDNLIKEIRIYGKPQRATGGHTGLDIYAPVGTPIHACVDGKISYHKMFGAKAGFLTQLVGKYKGKTYTFQYLHLMQVETNKFRFFNN
ncbi:MAG: hypothetical protein AAF620_05220, partial [Bacteroidota bacterium]